MHTGMRWLGMGMLALLWLSGCGGEKPAASATPAAAPPQSVDLAMPDPENFPQTTPAEALDSVIKALSEKRMDYFLSHLVTPDVRQRILTLNNFDLNAAAQKQLANEGRIASSMQEMTVFKKEGAVAYGKLGEGEYMLYVAVFERPGSDKILQFELIQNRWCFNSNVSARNENVQPWEGPKAPSAGDKGEAGETPAAQEPAAPTAEVPAPAAGDAAAPAE